MNYIIGMDVGTTAVKGVLYNQNGKKIKTISIGYELIQEQVDQAEEDPLVIFDAVQQIIFDFSNLAEHQISAISWSAQMHSLIGLDKNKELLTSNITWADNRAKNVVTTAKESKLNKQIYQLTGMPSHPMAPVYKLLWLKETNPQLFKHVNYWIGIKEYLIFRLTGKFATDISMAAGTGLLDLESLDWNETILQLVGIEKANLAKIYQSTDFLSGIVPEYAQKLGLNPNTKIVLGGSDGYLSTIGVGVLDTSSFAMNVGTSGAVRTICTKKCLDQKERFFCYAADKKQYLLGGPVNNGGIVVQWAKQLLMDFEATGHDFIDLAQSAEITSDGLLFFPYLGGERAPIWNPEAKGSFIGLTRKNTKAQMARSVLEGIIFNLLGAAESLIQNIGKPKMLKVTGGFVKTEFVCQLISDIFNLPVVTMEDDQSGAMAAMFLGRIALGWNNKMDDISEYNKENKAYFPNADNAEIYRKSRNLYRDIAQDLEKTYVKIADYQANN